MTNTTQPTPADLAALVADLNAIIAQQEARLRSQESQISEMYGDVVKLQLENRALERKAAASLANNLCPDHRDKQEGKPCLACEIDRLNQATAYAAQVTR